MQMVYKLIGDEMNDQLKYTISTSNDQIDHNHIEQNKVITVHQILSQR